MEIEAVHLKKRYGKKIVLQDINFSVREGQCIGIVGVNGSGKSTLLSILAGVMKADEGQWLFNQQPVFHKKRADNLRIGYVPQQNPLMEELTAWDNLKLWYCESSLDIKKELEQGMLAMLGISEFLKVPVHKLSGGMKKRLSIACAAANNPQLFIMDEPGAALDMLCKERIYNYIQEFKKKQGIILLATHEEPEIRLCDTIYILKNGKLEQQEYEGNIHKLVGKLL